MAPDKQAQRFRRRLWTVADFAAFVGISTKQARALLKRLDVELGGMLLHRTGGKTGFTFFPALLAKAKPEIFERVESIEARVEELEERLDEVYRRERMLASQVGQNSRDIGRLQRRPKAA